MDCDSSGKIIIILRPHEYPPERERTRRPNLHAQAHANEIIGLLNNTGYNGHLMQPMLEVRQVYLDAALEVIKNTSGNLENFVITELKADREKLRERFLMVK